MDEIEIYQIGLDIDKKMKILYFYKNSPFKILEFPKNKVNEELILLCFDFIDCCISNDDSYKKVSDSVVEEITHILEKS